MKIDEKKFNLVKIKNYHRFIFIYLLIVCSIKTIKISNANKYQEKTSMLIHLRTEISNLIKTIVEDELPFNISRNETLKYLKNHDNLHDAVLSAFKSIEEEFINFEKNIQNMNGTTTNKDKIEELFTRDMESQGRIVKEVRDHLKLIKQIKRDPQRKKEDIKRAYKKLNELNSELQKYDRSIKDRFFQEIEYFRAEAEESKTTSESLNRLFSNFLKIIDLKLSFLPKEKKKERNMLISYKEKVAKYKDYLLILSQTEKKRSETKEEVLKKMKKIFDSKIRFYKKVEKIRNLESALKRLALVYAGIVKIKENLLIKVKSVALKKLNELKEFINKKIQNVKRNNERIEKVKNIFKIAEKVSETKDKLSQIKNKLDNSLEKANHLNESLSITQNNQVKIEVENLANLSSEAEEDGDEEETSDDHSHIEGFGDNISLHNKTEDGMREFNKTKSTNLVNESNSENEQSVQEEHTSLEEEPSIVGPTSTTYNYELKNKKQITNLMINNTVNTNNIHEDHSQYTGEIGEGQNIISANVTETPILSQEREKSSENYTETFQSSSHDIKLPQNINLSAYITGYLKELSSTSKKALSRIEENNKKISKYDETLKLVLSKLNALTEDVDNLRDDQSEFLDDDLTDADRELQEYFELQDDEDYDNGLESNTLKEVRDRIDKLLEIYNDLKKESQKVHARNESLKNIVKVNTGILEQPNKIHKIKLSVKYHKKI